MEYRYTHLTNSVLVPQYFISYYIEIAYNIICFYEYTVITMSLDCRLTIPFSSCCCIIFEFCYNGINSIDYIQGIVFNTYN